ncbi:MAG: hypothetical protein FJX67_18120, partial [Alphaproteobacteria bacterium]|nr:hypothetical protein [Alphaproteobacteria bacterium]
APPPARIERVGRRYSRFVGLMRFLLPLAAGIVVALVVVWPQLRGEKDALRLDLVTVREQTAEGQNLTNARYTGSDQQNQPFAVTAARATQIDGGAAVLLDEPEADITLGDGRWLMVVAASGRYARATQLLELDGGVQLFQDDGHTLKTGQVVIDLVHGDAFAPLAVAAQGPFGELTAAGFQVHDRGARIQFLGETRLVLRPDGTTASAAGVVVAPRRALHRPQGAAR